MPCCVLITIKTDFVISKSKSYDREFQDYENTVSNVSPSVGL